jgi:acyl-CoA synthetase (AMP-forming)/AMP-acid ligase II
MAEANPTSLLDAFARRVSLTPDALFFRHHPAAYKTFGRVDDEVAALAGDLKAVGIGEGTRVALHLSNDSNWIVALLATWRLGASAVVLGGLLRAGEVVKLAIASETELVVTAQSELTLDDGPPVLRLTGAGRLAASAGSTPVPSANSPVHPGSPACVFATSGTTGTPKLVTHTHADLARSAAQMMQVYGGRTIFRPTAPPPSVPPGLILYPFGHIAGVHAFALRLWAGRRIVIVDRFDPAVLSTLVREEQIDVLQLVPAMVHTLATTTQEIDLSPVKYVTSGTAPLPPATREAFERRYGVPLLATYGSTEAGPVAHVRYVDVVSGHLPSGSVGSVAPGVQLRILDPSGAEVPRGDVGEIVVRKGETSEWVSTSDLGHLDDNGYLFVTGRQSDLMIVGGFNVFPADIEAAIERSGLGGPAVVVPLDDDRLGEVPAAGVVGLLESDIPKLIEFLRSEIAHYKVPRYFVGIDEVPLTERHKVDRIRAQELIRAAYLCQSAGER